MCGFVSQIKTVCLSGSDTNTYTYTPQAKRPSQEEKTISCPLSAATHFFMKDEHLKKPANTPFIHRLGLAVIL